MELIVGIIIGVVSTLLIYILLKISNPYNVGRKVYFYDYLSSKIIEGVILENLEMFCRVATSTGKIMLIENEKITFEDEPGVIRFIST